MKDCHSVVCLDCIPVCSGLICYGEWAGEY